MNVIKQIYMSYNCIMSYILFKTGLQDLPKAGIKNH